MSDFENATCGGDLIDADATSVEGNASFLRARATDFDGVGDDLKVIRVADWNGTASDNFETEFGKHPKHWFTAAIAMRNVAGQLDAYARVVRQAEVDAQKALEKWQRGDRLRKVLLGAPSYVDDPDKDGVDIMTEAEGELSTARKTVKDCGDTAATKIEGFTGKITDYEVDYSDSDFDVFDQGGDAKGPGFDLDKGEVRLADVDGHYEFFKHDFAWQKGPIDVEGEGSVKVGVHGRAAIDEKGAHVGVGAEAAGTYKAEQKVPLPFGMGEMGVGGDLRVGPSVTLDYDFAEGDDGRWHFKPKVGASGLFGVGASPDIPIPKPVSETAKKVWDKMPW